MINLRNIQDAEVINKTVLLRADLDVPFVQKSDVRSQMSEISDDTRLEAWFPTLEYLLSQKAKVIIVGHLGRPSPAINHQPSTITQNEFSLKPVAGWIAERFKINDLRLKNFEGFEGWEINENISVLENLRFYKEEEENDLDFSQKLASLADIYVNDAFASSHRAHASIVGVTKYLPSFAGLRLEKEIKELAKVLENPKRPLVVIIGGAKIETKLPLVEKMHHFADYVLVGGELSEKDNVLIRVMHEKADKVKSMLFVADLTESKKEITEYSTENFIQVINKSKTVVWNGPMGQVEKVEYSGETKKIAQAIIQSQAYSIVGGGDTIAFLKKLNLLDKFDFVSMGGGAMLEFLSGEKLPGLEALSK